MSTELKERIRYAIEAAADRVDGVFEDSALLQHLEDAYLAAGELPGGQMELPLYDSRIHTDANTGLAWRYIGGVHKVVVNLRHATLLAEANGNTGKGHQKARIVVEERTDSAGNKSVVKVSKAKTNMGALVLVAEGQPQPTPQHTPDHLDWNPLNNVVENLQWATKEEQNRRKRITGTSQFFGVYWHKRSERWRVQIMGPDKSVRTGGGYVDEVEAARSADVLSIKLYGLDAKTNVKLGLLDPLPDQLTLPLGEPPCLASAPVVAELAASCSTPEKQQTTSGAGANAASAASGGAPGS